MADSRLFQLLYLLLEHQRMTAGELAERLEVSTRTIYRDVDALSQAGVPIYATQGKGGGVALMEHYTLDRAVLSGEEQARLLTALRSLPDGLGGEEVATKLSAIFRPSQPDWLAVELTPWQSRGNGGDFRFYKNAILERHVLELTYISAYSVERRYRILPARLVFKGRTWYLQGWRLDREEYRTYRLSRVLDVADTGTVMALPQPPPDIEAGFQVKNAAPITLRFSPAMAYRVYDEFDSRDIEREDGGALQVRVLYPIDSWLYGYLLSFGVGVEVIEPVWLKEQLALLGREIYRANAEPDTLCQVCPDILDSSNRKETKTMDFSQMKFCQSCGMPLMDAETHGTEADGSASADYCKYCYQQGAFTSSMTMEEMIDFCVPHMVAANPGMTPQQAKAQMEQFFPMLLRWKKD